MKSSIPTVLATAVLTGCIHVHVHDDALRDQAADENGCINQRSGLGEASEDEVVGPPPKGSVMAYLDQGTRGEGRR